MGAPPPKIFLKVMEFFIPPLKNFSVCEVGLKTETGKFHEILIVFFLLHEHLQRKSTFLIPAPQIFVCVGGLKLKLANFCYISKTPSQGVGSKNIL